MLLAPAPTNLRLRPQASSPMLLPGAVRRSAGLRSTGDRVGVPARRIAGPLRSARLHVRAQAGPAAPVTALPFAAIAAGKPEPLGPSRTADGINFALFSRNAKAAKLCLFDGEAQQITEVDCKRT
ncbi:hypothetical protein TSOC_015135, partial [Tetrabaena socialis]